MANIIELIIRGSNQSEQAIQSTVRHLTSLQTVAGSAQSAIASLAGGVGFAALAKSALELGDSLAKSSQKFGVSVEELSVMKYAAKMADVEFDALGKALKFLSVNAAASAVGTGEANDAFKAMGISVRDSSGHLKLTADLFDEVAKKMSGYADSSAKANLAAKIFGRAGTDIIPVLNEWGAGSAKIREEAEKLGVVLSGGQAKRLEEYEQWIKKITIALKGWAATSIMAAADAYDAYNAGGGNMFSRKWNATQTGKISSILVPNPEPAKGNAPLIEDLAEKDKQFRELIRHLNQVSDQNAKFAESSSAAEEAVRKFSAQGLTDLDKKLEELDEALMKFAVTQSDAIRTPEDFYKFLENMGEATELTKKLKEEIIRKNDAEISRIRVMKESSDWSESMQAEMGYGDAIDSTTVALENYVDAASKLTNLGDAAGALRILDDGMLRQQQIIKESQEAMSLYSTLMQTSFKGMGGYVVDFGNVVSEGFKGMEDALVKFAMTGKLEFKNLADSIIANLVRIAIQASITSKLGGALGGFLGGAMAWMWGGGGVAAEALETVGPGLVLLAEKGRVFDGGNVTPFASGGIVTRPTVFPMARGGMGLMGEAGPEAVMPLIRTRGGNLGVRADGGGDGSLTVILNVDGEALYKVVRKGVRTGALNLQLV